MRKSGHFYFGLTIYKELYEKGGELALQDISRRKPCFKNRVEESIEQAVLAFAIEKPAYGQLRVSNELKKTGVFISPGLHFIIPCPVLEGSPIT